MKFLNVFLAAVTVVSSMPTPQEGVFLEPVDREIMVVEKYNYKDFMSSFFSNESVQQEAPLPRKHEEPRLPQERETTPENTYEVPIPQTPTRGNEYNSRKRPNRWVPRSSNVRRRFEEPPERNGSFISGDLMAPPL